MQQQELASVKSCFVSAIHNYALSWQSKSAIDEIVSSNQLLWYHRLIKAASTCNAHITMHEQRLLFLSVLIDPKKEISDNWKNVMFAFVKRSQMMLLEVTKGIWAGTWNSCLSLLSQKNKQ